MSTAVLNRETVDARPLPEVEGVLDVHVNALDVEDLFALYERTGFLYPAKAARLTPYLAVVQDNWRRLLRAKDSLLYVLTSGDEDEGCASVAVWRTTRESWVWQHLVCESNPLRSRAVMLGGLVRCMERGLEKSQQNWFRPDNRFPARVFGSMVQSLGESFSSVRSHLFFAVPRLNARRGLHRGSSVQIVPYDCSHHAALCTLASRARGGVYVTAEELDRDVELQSVDCLYRSVGLRRARQVWLAYRKGSNEALGAAIAYRGPLGLNFSFLENRCDLLLDPMLSAADAAAVTPGLIEASMAAYTDFELDEIPVVADSASEASMCALGGQFLRNYCQGIWLQDGQAELYRHVDRFYTRLLNRAERRSVPSTLTR
jgi:hypothetical protein